MTLIADMFADQLKHRRIDGDLENNAILDALVGALADTFDRIGLIGFGDPASGVRGDQVLTDPSVAPPWALAHAALYTGALLPPRRVGESEPDYLVRARDAAVYPLGIRRGTHQAVRRAIQPELTGTRSVFIGKGTGVYDLYVRTLASETPDPDLVERLLEGDFVSGGARGAIRAELALEYEATDAVSWAEATLSWSEVADGVVWSTATVDDLT